MDIGTISSRYAKALFSLAKDKGQESRVYDDMGGQLLDGAGA